MIVGCKSWFKFGGKNFLATKLNTLMQYKYLQALFDPSVASSLKNQWLMQPKIILTQD